MTDLVHLQVEPPGAAERDRKSAILRPILIVPHVLLVGGPFFGFRSGYFRTGALGFLAATIALLDWFSIVFRGRALGGLQGLKRYYLHWRARLLAYAFFLRDEYPPFGDGPYPVSLELPEEPGERDRVSVGFRLILLIPHLVVLFFLFLAQLFVCIASWLIVSITAHLPEGLWRFGRDVAAYALRVEAYGLLVHDRYPSFALADRRHETLPAT